MWARATRSAVSASPLAMASTIWLCSSHEHGARSGDALRVDPLDEWRRSLDRLGQHRVARQSSTSSVWKRVLSAGSAVRSPRSAASQPCLDDGAHRRQLGVGAARRGEAGDEPLEHLAHLEQLAGPGLRDDRHTSAAPRLELDEALAGERLQRFADRVAGHVELGRDLVLEDALARGVARRR